MFVFVFYLCNYSCGHSYICYEALEALDMSIKDKVNKAKSDLQDNESKLSKELNALIILVVRLLLGAMTSLGKVSSFLKLSMSLDRARFIIETQ
ncbi:HTH-type transcriptional regulator [Acrasis kona]|uniref:HTH-type transcriptional regulator n=1 Tax=Acrasis kona TaxID=1008807 RepID=A0AAW2ZJ87_9EUKA